MRAQLLARIRGAPILPDNGVVKRLSGIAIPDQRRFALIGNSDRSDVGDARTGARQSLARRIELRRPELQRVLFNPASLRVMHCQFLLRHAQHLTVNVDDERS